jgi:hypothetical protein
MITSTTIAQKKQVNQNPFFEKYNTPYNVPAFDKIKEFSYLKYGKDRNIVEEEIMAKYKKPEPPPMPPIAGKI